MASKILARVAQSLPLVVAIFCAMPIQAHERNESAGAAAIVRVDPRFDKLVPPDAKLEKIADGFTWVEGPVWDRQGRYLLFSDIPANAVYKWKDGEGVSLFLKPSGYLGATPFPGQGLGSNGLTLDNNGHLVLCQHGERRIARLDGGAVRSGWPRAMRTNA